MTPRNPAAQRPHDVFHFTANLKPYTFLERPEDERFDAYLLSADYARGLSEMAAQVRQQQRELVADNGNVDLLRDFARRFRPEAAPLDEARKVWEDEHDGRYARPGQLPTDLSDAFRALAGKIAAASDAQVTAEHTRDALARQTSIAPTFLIGMEDLTLGTLATLNIEPEYASLPQDFFEKRIGRAVSLARRTEDGEFGPVSGQVLAGLHAVDFDSAVLAGGLAAEAGLKGVAVGLFGALTDRNYVDFRVQDGQVIELERAVPRPYLRVLEIVAGLVEGYRRAGRPRPAFHALGAGTPILLPLLALLGDGEPYFATDSTSPIVDGWSSPTISLYVDDPAPLKLKAYKIAASWIEGAGVGTAPAPTAPHSTSATHPTSTEPGVGGRRRENPGSPSSCSSGTGRSRPSCPTWATRQMTTFGARRASPAWGTTTGC